MNISIKKSEIENLTFILFEFVRAHEDNEDNLYCKEIELSNKILEQLKK